MYTIIDTPEKTFTKEDADRLKSQLRALGSLRSTQLKRRFLVDIIQLKSLIHTYYHNPIADLLEDDNKVITPKLTAWRPGDRRTCSMSLAVMLAWHDLHSIIQGFNAWDDHVLRTWVGRPLPLVKGADPWPKVTMEHSTRVINGVIEQIEKYL